MNQAFDPLDFLAVARSLAANQREAELRTAVGRAYYALFLLARDKLAVSGGPNVHQRVITQLRGRPGYRAAADQLDALRRLRVVADYEPLPTDAARRNWEANWARADVLAGRLLGRLQTLS